jgi:hypothetical protein
MRCFIDGPAGFGLIVTTDGNFALRQILDVQMIDCISVSENIHLFFRPCITPTCEQIHHPVPRPGCHIAAPLN